MLPFPYTHPWSRLQKALIIATAALAVLGFAVASYLHHHAHRLPDESVLFGAWQMTAPHDPHSSTVLGLYDFVGLNYGIRYSHWHDGLWARHDIAKQFVEGYSEMRWYAGGSYIYRRVHDERQPLVWQIIHIGPEELRLRRAKRNYVFRRLRDERI